MGRPIALPGADPLMAAAPEPAIQHDPGRRFWLELDGDIAYLAYRVVDDTTVDYASTWTPHALRGRGVATRLVRYALAWAHEQDLKVVPSCWFVQKILAQTPGTSSATD
ncbi:MAG: N-acetyltransferase [Gemmatimonadota bacterium]|nr:N-acetyltransferase [Gemmatimonadota bacterium]MDH5197263.1 N-acetyltransferase [Gemmatimonadota bacterium]